MPHFAVFVINNEGIKERRSSSTSYGFAVSLAQEAFQRGARGAWVETAGADDPVVKYKLGEVPTC